MTELHGAAGLSPDSLPSMVQNLWLHGLDWLGRRAPRWVHSLVAVAALVETCGHLLVLQRQDGRGLSLPGGLLQWREAAAAGLQREVMEETGLAISVEQLFDVYSDPERDDRLGVIVVVYQAAPVGGACRDSREGRAAWMDLEQPVPTMAFHDDRIVRDYLRRRPGWRI